MKEFNLQRILEGFYVYDNMTEEEQEAIFNRLCDMELDLNEFNSDDYIVNGLMKISKKEAEENDAIILLEYDDDEDVLCESF